MRRLKDGGRNDGEYGIDIVLGFISDEVDYDGVLLVDAGVIHHKELVIDSHFI